MLYAVIDVATQASHTIVSGVTGKKIRVVSYLLTAAGSVTVTWKRGSTGLTGAITLATGVPLPAAPMPEGARGGQYGHFETDQGEALVLTLGGAVQVSGHVAYVLVS